MPFSNRFLYCCHSRPAIFSRAFFVGDPQTIASREGVENMWGGSGNGADDLSKISRGHPGDRRNADFSTPPQEIPLHTQLQKLMLRFTSDTFPPIHSAHHNNKGHFFRNKKTLVRIVASGWLLLKYFQPKMTTVEFLSFLPFPQIFSLPVPFILSEKTSTVR
jgi:hypothetical protein